MKKYFSNIRTLVALLMAGAAFAACSNDENAIEQPANPAGEKVYTLTVNASKGGATTRALKLETSGALTAYWTNGDELTVYNKTKEAALTGTLTASNANGSTATFSGSLTGTIETNDVLTLSYHQPTGFSAYAAQTGTLASAAERDFATADVTVASVTSGNITTTANASFETQTAVLKLTLEDNAATPNKLNATQLKLSATMTVSTTLGDLPLTAELAAFELSSNTYSDGDGVLYFALPPNAVAAEYVANKIKTDYPAYKTYITTDAVATALSGATITYTATYNSDTYVATKTGYTFAAAKYYAGTLTMEKQLLSVVVDDGFSEYGDKTIYFEANETWSQAITNHPTKNAGWYVDTQNNKIYHSNGSTRAYVFDSDPEPDAAVLPTAAIDANGDYYFGEFVDM